MWTAELTTSASILFAEDNYGDRFMVPRGRNVFRMVTNGTLPLLDELFTFHSHPL